MNVRQKVRDLIENLIIHIGKRRHTILSHEDRDLIFCHFRVNYLRDITTTLLRLLLIEQSLPRIGIELITFECISSHML